MKKPRKQTPWTPEQERRKKEDEETIARARALEDPVIEALRPQIQRYVALRFQKIDGARQHSRGLRAEAAREILAEGRRSGKPQTSEVAYMNRVIRDADTLYWSLILNWDNIIRRMAQDWSCRAPVGMIWPAQDLHAHIQLGMHRGLLRYEVEGSSAPLAWCRQWALPTVQRSAATAPDLSGGFTGGFGWRRPQATRALHIDNTRPACDFDSDDVLPPIQLSSHEDLQDVRVGDAHELAGWRKELDTKLQRVSPIIRERFVRRYLQGESNKSIARDQGVSHQVVSSSLDRNLPLLGEDVQRAVLSLRAG